MAKNAENGQRMDAATIDPLHRTWGIPATDEVWHLSSPALAWVEDGFWKNYSTSSHGMLPVGRHLYWVDNGVKPSREHISRTRTNLKQCGLSLSCRLSQMVCITNTLSL